MWDIGTCDLTTCSCSIGKRLSTKSPEKEGLFSALRRMQVPEHPRLVIEAIYSNPLFMVEMEGETSMWHRQDAGIRQGCPLSPYLFLIVMTAMFADIHKDDTIDAVRHRRQSITFDEVLYADDTICISSNSQALQRLLHAIERENAKYGMRL